MTLKIKVTKIIYIMIIFVCIERLLETIGFPHTTIFILDFLNLILFWFLCKGEGLNEIIKHNMVKIHLLLFIVSIINSLLNGTNILLILWAIRNLWRFYVFFGACIYYLKFKDIIRIYNYLEVIFFINLSIIIFQYIIGIRGDYLGGIFGTFAGANAYNNIFMIIINSYIISKMFENQEWTLKTIIIVLISIMISVISETKVFLFEIVIIIAISAIITGVINKKYKVICKGFVVTIFALSAVLFGAQIIAKMFPSRSNMNFLSIDGLRYILTRESGYTGYGDLNRLTAISSLNKIPVFYDNTFRQIMGLGLGAGEYSETIRILQSPFYLQYNYLHYYWLSIAWMYIECGYVGVFLYMFGFISNIPKGINVIRKKTLNKSYSPCVISGIIMSFMTLILFIYNQSLRIESAYLIFFALSAITIGDKEIGNKEIVKS